MSGDQTEAQRVDGGECGLDESSQLMACARCKALVAELNDIQLCSECEIKASLPGTESLVWSDEKYRRRLALGAEIARWCVIGGFVRLAACVCVGVVFSKTTSRTLGFAAMISDLLAWVPLIGLIVALVLLIGKERTSEHRPGFRRTLVIFAAGVIVLLQCVLTLTTLLVVAGSLGNAKGDQAAFIVDAAAAAALFNFLIAGASPYLVWLARRISTPGVEYVAANLGFMNILFTALGAWLLGIGVVWPMFWMHATFRMLRDGCRQASEAAAAME